MSVKTKIFHEGQDLLPLISRIDADPLLVKRDHPTLPLRIANKGKALFTPKEEHQLYAKGIVYERETLLPISLPLVKFYNLFELEGFPLHPEEFDHIIVSKKYDGTMIQVFFFGGELVVTTRGTFDSEYTATARELLARHQDWVDQMDRDRTYVFELIHPDHRNVIDYGEEERLVLLAMYHNTYRYYAHDKYLPLYWPDTAEYTCVTSLEEAVRLGNQDRGEGCVLSFASGHKIIHRIKVKTEEYIKLYKLVNNCSYKTVWEMLETTPIRDDWSAFRDRHGLPEELEQDYMTHYYRACGHLRDMEAMCEMVQHETEAMKASGLERYPFVEWVRQTKDAAHFSLYMSAYDGKLTTAQVIRKMGIEPQENT